MANIEVNIDFPEYEDALEITLENLPPRLKEIKKELENLLDEAKVGKLISEGIKVAIVGRPNVGKSSILNHLLQENKAIVTDIAGTTRDIVEGELELKGIRLKFIDTAGIRKTEDVVERIGVDKSLEMIKEADLVIHVLNNNEELTNEDKEIQEKIKGKTKITFINKSDLESKIEIKDIDKEMVESLKQLEPFGEGNRMPVFVFKNLKIDSIRALSEGKHLKLTLKDNNTIINSIGFNLRHLAEEYRIGDKIDIVGVLEINSFNGVESLQINMKDVMRSL